MSPTLSTLPQDLSQLDASDVLATKKQAFDLPADVIYLDGNSLGPSQPNVKARVSKVLEQQWGTELIRSWTGEADWMHLPDRVAAKIAPLIGAESDEIAVGDSTGINTFKVLVQALALARSDRKVILTDADNFPTDLYIAQGINKLLGNQYEIRTVPNTEIYEHLTDDVAVTLFTEVDYRTGRKLDMAGLTARAHELGILTIWDLAHSAGAFAVHLNKVRADFAIGCGYKYLNGGPGAPSFLFVAKRHQDAAPVFVSGWWGHEDPFLMARTFTPASGARRFVVGTAQILSLSALDEALNIFADVDLEVLRQKSLSLTNTFIRLMKPLVAQYPLQLVTPLNEDERGSQVSYSHPQAKEVMNKLIELGIMGDFRTPDILRFGFTPLYHSHADVWQAVEGIKTVLAETVLAGKV